jgi:predicted short-subunit dehydrogenase-like oxidoreductase (DUF2520 family)
MVTPRKDKSSRKSDTDSQPGPIAVVGIGRVGTALAWSLHTAGYRIADLVVRRKPSAAQTKLAQDVGASLVQFAQWQNSTAQTIWLCVPDDALAETVGSLHQPAHLAARTWLHTSGSRSYRELLPLKSRTTVIGAAHPFRSFPQAERAELSETYFGIEGEKAARDAATAMVWRMGGLPFTLKAGTDKALYHAFGTFASPLLTALLAAGAELGERAGIPPEIVPRLLASLAGGTFTNWQHKGAAQGLSGPIPRGDIETIELHLASLTGMPELHEVYRALSVYAATSLPARRRAALLKALRIAKAGQP